MTSGLLAGKRGLIMGVANKRSLAWGAACACVAHGAEVALSYQNATFEKRLRPLAETLGCTAIYPCDAGNESELDALYESLKADWGTLDFVVHAIAFSDRNQLAGRYIDTTEENFTHSLAISCYSFTALARRMERLMPDGGSMLTYTYYGSEKVMPHYNVMGVAKAALEASLRYLAADLGPGGIRVNAISAGPIRTLAAAGIGDFRYILKWNEYNSPLRHTIDIDDVGKASVFLLSDLSSAVTGEVLHVDNGYHIVGMKAEDAPDIDIVLDR